MEIYIEIVIVEQFILHLLCYISSTILVNKFLSLKKMIFHTLLMILISFNLYFKFPDLVVFLYIFIVHLFLFNDYFIYFFLSYMISYFVFVFTLMYFDQTGFFKYGVYAATNIELSDFIFLVIVFLCYCIHSVFLKRSLTLKELKYQLQFEYEKQHYHLTMYMDTGNSASYQGKPIIFIKKECFNPTPKYHIQVCSINGFSDVPLVYLKKLLINDEIYYDVYVGILNDLKHNDDGLLNVALIYKG